MQSDKTLSKGNKSKTEHTKPSPMKSTDTSKASGDQAKSGASRSGQEGEKKTSAGSKT